MRDKVSKPQIRKNGINKVHREIYDLIIKEEGYSKQIWKVVEELGELQTAIAKHARNEGDAGAVAKELIDVEIVAEKLRYILEDEHNLDKIKRNEFKRLKQEFK